MVCNNTFDKEAITSSACSKIVNDFGPPHCLTMVDDARKLGSIDRKQLQDIDSVHASYLFFLLPFCLLVTSESLIPKPLSLLVWAIFETLVQQKRWREQDRYWKINIFLNPDFHFDSGFFCSLFHTHSHVWVCICINAENKGPYKYSFVCKQGYSLLFQKCLPSVYKPSVAKSHSRKISWIPAGQWYHFNNAHQPKESQSKQTNTLMFTMSWHN